MDSNRKPKSNRSGSTATTTRTTTMTIVEAAAAAAVAAEEESNEGDQHQQWIESSSSCSSSSWSAAAASKKKWKCAQCTYENWPSSMRCVICLCDKNASLSTTPNMYSSTSSLSSCQATGCSSTTSGGGSSNQKKKIIPATVQQSVMTGGGGSGSSPKDTAKTVELVAHDHLGKWSCPQCTYLNWPKSPKCAACYTPRVSFSSSSSSSNNSTSEQHNHHNHHSNDLASTNSGNNPVNNINNGNVEPSLLKTVCQQQQHQKSGGQKSNKNSPKNSPLNRSLCNSPVPPTMSATPPPQQPLNTTAATTTTTTTATVNATVVSKPQTPEPHITHINQSSECTTTATTTTTTTTHHTDPTVELIPTNQQTISISTSSKQQLSSTTTTSDQALKKWSCSACTYQNWPKAQRCVMCLVPRHAQLTPMTTSTTTTTTTTTTNQPSNRVMINLKEQKLQQQQQQQQQQQMVMMSSLQIHMDRLFLAACEGVVDGDMAPINRYLGAGGDLTRYLTSDECKMLNRPSIFKVGLTLLHLCYQFKRKEFLIKLLNQKSHVSNLTLQQQQHYQAKVINTLIKQINSAKFSPCQSCPSLASNIVDRYFSACLRQRKTPSSLTQRFMLQQQLNPESSALFNNNNNNNNACCSSSVCSGGGEGISPSSSLISLNNSHHHQQHYSSKKKQHHNHHHFHHHHSPSPSPPPSSSAAAASSLFGAAAAVGGAAAAATAAASNDVACFYVNESHTFTLPSEIEDFAPKIQSILFDELLDREVQQELEYECRVINWNLDICKRLSSRLYPLWNRHSGDCLLDSVLQACYGVFDTDNILRRVMADTLEQFACYLKPRWKEHEILMARSLDYHIDDYQLEQDWSNIISLANQPGASLEQAHIFALAHIFRRPIIVYSVKYVKSFRGENIGFTHFEGVYLPLIWEPSFCFKSPIALGYTRGHFTALVPLDRPDIYTYVFPPQSTTSAGSTSTSSTCEAAASSSVGGACGGGGGGSSGSDSFSSSSFSSSPSAAQLPTSSSSVMMTSPADENLNLLNGGAMAIGTGTNQAVVTTSTTGNSNSSVSNENSEKTSGGGAATTTTTTTNQLGAVSSEYGSGCEPSSSQQVFYLPLTNNEGQLLPVHFLTHQELGRERTILRQYLNLDCLVMQGNCSLLAAQQRVVKRGMLVKQMLDEWLSYYRNMQAKEMGKQIEVIHEQNSEDQLVIENNNNDYEDDDDDDDDDEDDDEDEEEEEDDDDEEQDEEDYEEEEDEEEDDDDDEDDDVEDDEYCEKVNVQ